MRHFSNASRFSVIEATSVVEPGPPRGQQVDHVEHLEVLDAAKQHRQHDERQRHRQRDRPELPPGRGAVDLGRLVDVVGDRAQAREADQHHVGRPHPGIDDDDRPGRKLTDADHLEGRWRDAGEEGDDVVEQPDLRLVEEPPEIADHRRRQHHRDQDHRGPEAVAAEFAVDQIGEREADAPSAARSSRTRNAPWPASPPRCPGRSGSTGSCRCRPLHRRIGPVGAVIGEGELDRPDQRKDVDRQQQDDRRRDEQPGDRPVREARGPRRPAQAASRRPPGARSGRRWRSGGSFRHGPLCAFRLHRGRGRWPQGGRRSRTGATVTE